MPDIQESNRDEQGKFVPGKSGNPNGRPKKGQTLTDLMKEYLATTGKTGMTRKEEFIKKVAIMAYTGDMTAIKLIWNYLDGMPVQSIKASIERGLGDITNDELDRAIQSKTTEDGENTEISE